MAYTSKAKLLVAMIGPPKYFKFLTLLVMGSYWHTRAQLTISAHPYLLSLAYDLIAPLHQIQLRAGRSRTVLSHSLLGAIFYKQI